MKKKYRIYLVFFCLIPLLTACATTPVFNILQSGFSAPEGRTDKDVQQAILSGAKQAGWTANVISPNEIQAAYNSQNKSSKKTHGARVAITYDVDSYRINYHSSLNLNYKTLASSGKNYPITTQNKVIRIQQSATIENVYNEWVTALNESINYQLNALKIAPVVVAAEPENKNKICNHKPDQSFSKQATVTFSRGNIRDGAGKRCGIVGVVTHGEKITLLGRKRNWYYFKKGKKHAWIYKTLIKIEQE
jgi:hypothetical protein